MTNWTILLNWSLISWGVNELMLVGKDE